MLHDDILIHVLQAACQSGVSLSQKACRKADGIMIPPFIMFSRYYCHLTDCLTIMHEESPFTQHWHSLTP